MLPADGFIVSIPSVENALGFYLLADLSYRVVPPAGWAIIPGSEGGVEFRSRIADQGYWPVMMISKEPARSLREIGTTKEVGVNALAARDRDAFRFISGEAVDLPTGRAYLVIYEHTFENRRMRTAEAHFVRNGVRYWVPFNALSTTFDRHFPVYLNCLRTFAPLDPENGQVCN